MNIGDKGLRVRKPDGTKETIAAEWFEHMVLSASSDARAFVLEGEVLPSQTAWKCSVFSGTVCEHGYRVDPYVAGIGAELDHRNGDGCVVVGIDRSRELRRIGSGVRELAAVSTLGAEVEVLLDDGRVVLTRTTSAVWSVGGDTSLVKLEGFTGGYAVSRCRAPGFAWKVRFDKIRREW